MKHLHITKDKSFYKDFFSVWSVLVLYNVITLGVNLLDNVMVSAYSEAAMAGVSAVNQVQFLFQQLMLGAGDAVVVLGSQYWGQKRTESIKRFFMGALLLGAVLVNRIAGYRNRRSYFIIELPEYKFPSLKRAVTSMLARGKSYIVKAGTVILVCNTVVQIMQSFNWKLQLIEEGMESTSILATIANPVSVLLIPIGVGAWQMAAAAVTGFIAKENVVGTLAVCYGISNMISTEDLTIAEGVAGTEIAAAPSLWF